MSLDDEEDNDLYGSAKKSKRVKCSSCGDLTHLGTATGERAKAGLCVGCFRTLETQSWVDDKGVRHWRNISNTNVKKTPYDSRGGREGNPADI